MSVFDATNQGLRISVHSEISNVIALPAAESGGYQVLKDNAAAPDSDQSQWTNVLVFAPTAGAATSVQLFSVGCNTPTANDRSCFPSFATVTADPDSAFIVETKGAATVFNAGGSIYSVDDNPPTGPSPWLRRWERLMKTAQALCN